MNCVVYLSPPISATIPYGTHFSLDIRMPGIDEDSSVQMIYCESVKVFIDQACICQVGRSNEVLEN